MHVEIPHIALGAGDDKTSQPERKLLTAVITLALRDLKDPKHRAEARAFFKSKRFDLFCDCLTLDATAIRKKVL
jgi:hypothetical protein